MLEIAPLDETSMNAIIGCDGGNGWKNDSTAWAEIFNQHSAGARFVLVATGEKRAAAYGSLLWQSAYPAFASRRIPELHDLVTAKPHRHRGIATKLIACLEEHARAAGHKQIGLGVGLYADHGPAQRLYSTNGYVLDGRGATYRNQYVAPGASTYMDDDLILWMTKTL